MTTSRYDVVPAEQREIARSAVQTAFGSSPLADLRPVAGGASGALTYRIEAGGRPYLLRVEVRRTPMRNPHQYACMQSAADAGIAPPVRYIDADAGVAIMDFLSEQPQTDYPGGPPALARAVGTLIARLRTTPPFPPLLGYRNILDRMFGFLRGSGVFAPGLLDPYTEGYERIRDAYPWDAEAAVSSHNDPNPRNVLFDGERLWLIDWETAYRNDPMVDAAIVTDQFAADPALETALFEGLLGQQPDRVWRARLALMRVLTRLYYAGLIFATAVPRGAPETSIAALTPDEFRSEIGDGRLKMGTPETTLAFGKILLAQFLAGLAASVTGEALAVLRRG